MMMKPNVLLITILVLIIVLFKYVYLIVFGLPYKYINYYKFMSITLSSKCKIEVCFVLYYTQ